MTARQDTISALAHAAHTFSRLAVQKTNWARTAAAEGMYDTAEKWMADAERFRAERDDHMNAAYSQKQFWENRP